MTKSMNLGPYELRGELGRGAMAKVWRAWDPKLEREVAIKEPLFDEKLSEDILTEMGARFVKEGKAAARLNHPGIVTIYAADVYDSRPVIVMELIEGITLGEILEAGALAPQVALDALGQLLDAVGYAHSQGVVHRDIKPDNIFITKDGRVKLSDFGIARIEDGNQTKATQIGTVLGTPGYMAPEQATGSAVDNRTDLFAIGTIAYEMLTGQNPFGAGQSADATTLIYRIVHQAAPSLPEAASVGLPADIRPAVLAALNKNPQERPQDAASFKAMLNGAPAPPASSAPAPIMAPVTMVNAPTLQGQAATPSGSKKWLPYGIVGGIGVVAIVLVFAFASSGGSAGGGGMVSSGSTPPEETRVVADEEEGQGEAFYLTIMGGKVAVFQGSPGGSSSLDYITDIDASSLKPGSVSLLEEGVVATDLKTLNALLDVYKEEAAHTEPGASNTYHYVLPDSSSRYYARTELERLDSWELYIARNEVFARHGRGFMNEDLRNYFFGQPWYVQLYTPLEFDELPSPLNDYEKKNTELIRSIETARNSPYL